MNFAKNIKREIIGKMKKRNYGPKKKKTWSKDEISMLKKEYENYTDVRLSKIFKNKTASLIGDKRRSLGLYKYQDFHNRVWTKEETKLLARVWKDYSQRELRENFFPNKTVTQIRNKKMDMGLKKGPKWSAEEIDILFDYAPLVSNKELSEKYLPLKTNIQISCMRKYYGIKFENHQNLKSN